MNVETVVRDYLPQIIHMSLGTSKNNKPWVCEVHFTYDDNLNLYYRSKTDRRHSQEIAANPFVAGSIVRQHVLDEYPLGIYFEGTAKMLTEESDIKSAFPLFQKVLGSDETILEDTALSGGHKFYKVSVSTWSVFGKFGDEDGKKYELAWTGAVK